MRRRLRGKFCYCPICVAMVTRNHGKIYGNMHKPITMMMVVFDQWFNPRKYWRVTLGWTETTNNQ